MNRTDAAEASARALLEAEWTDAHKLAATLNAGQRRMLENSLIAAHVGGSAWAFNHGGASA